MDLSVSLAARDSSQGLGPGFGLNGLPGLRPQATKKPKKAVLFFGGAWRFWTPRPGLCSWTR